MIYAPLGRTLSKLSTAGLPVLLAALYAGLLGATLSPRAVAQAVPSLPALETTAQPAPAAATLALSVSEADVQSLSLPYAAGEPFAVTLRLAGSERVLLLEPISLRAPGFQLMAQLADGSYVAETVPPPATYRGVVARTEGGVIAGSIVAGSLIDGQLSALVRLAPDQPVHGVQPLSALQPGVERALHVVYDAGNSLPAAWRCGVAESLVRDLPGPPSSGPGDGGPADMVCQIACDADFEYYQSNSSSTVNTQNDIENVLNGVEAIYQSNVGIQYEITTTLVRTAEPDPYTTSDAGGLLNQFSSHWNSSQQAIVRDVAHLFTGKNIDGSIIGIAQLSVICNKNSAYGLSQSKFSGSYTSRVGLTAHELGHNWSAQHCDGASDCKIMCSGLGGCTGSLTSFGVGEQAQILAKKASVSCLSSAVPPPAATLTLLNPSSVQAFDPVSVTVKGTGFQEVSGVLVGATLVPVGAGVTVVNSTTVTLLPPPAAALGGVSVRVVNPGGNSNPITLTYTETNPPVLVAGTLGFTSQAFNWSYGGGANDPALLILGLTHVTFTYQGQSVLATNLILSSAPLNAAGIGGLSLTLPASAAGLLFWSQVVTLDGPTAHASNIVNSWVIY
ncbi:MAG: M12 family metallo-peptidase [Planctomycetota bacterium]